MKADIPPDTLVPPELIAEIEAAAEQERREPRELIGEAVERYLSEQRLFPRDEVHRKIAQALGSLRQGRGLEGETVMAELLTELDTPPPTR
jgi:hypothetical protein